MVRFGNTVSARAPIISLRFVEYHRTIADRVEQEVDQLLLMEARAHRDQLVARLRDVTHSKANGLNKIERLILEEIQRARCGPQGRRGAPGSPLCHHSPVMLYLARNGLSAAKAWHLLGDERTGHSLDSARRMLNKHRDPVEKAVDQAASAVVLGKPKTFATAYRRIIKTNE